MDNQILSKKEIKKFKDSKAKMIHDINLLWNEYAILFEENKILKGKKTNRTK